jgi:hypothetical protein
MTVPGRTVSLIHQIFLSGRAGGTRSFVSLRSLQSRRLLRLRLSPSFRVQQTCHWHVSPTTSFTLYLLSILIWQGWRDSNPQHPVLETGALPIGATALSGLLMDRMLLTPPAIFFYFQSIRRIFFIFLAIVISSLALRAFKNNYLPQFFPPLLFIIRKRKEIS